MITKIAPGAPVNIAESKMDGASSMKESAAPKHDPKIAKVAAQFEEVFVRQLLSAAKMGGDNKEGGGYGAMTIDALATGVSQGGGLGIAQQIEAAMSRSSEPATHAFAPDLSAAAAIPETPKK
jgi:Rod binding domain-containing protein